jgi:hypothetical protein
MRSWTYAFCEYPMTEDRFAGAVQRVADAGRDACLGIETARLKDTDANSGT